MKLKKVILSALVVVLLTTGIALASSNVKVFVNGKNAGEIGEIINDTAYLPLRKVAEYLQAVVYYDSATKTANIYKPNVHMFVYQEDNNLFGMVEKGANKKFKISAQADNVKFNVSSIRFTITDPNNKETVLSTIKIENKSDVYWVTADDLRYRFSLKGDYIIKCYFKTDLGNEWDLVSEKYIPST